MPGCPSSVCPSLGRLSVELDSSGSVEFWCQASDLIPEQPCSGVSVLLPRPWPCPLTWTSQVPRGPAGAQAFSPESPPQSRRPEERVR